VPSTPYPLAGARRRNAGSTRLVRANDLLACPSAVEDDRLTSLRLRRRVGRRLTWPLPTTNLPILPGKLYNSEVGQRPSLPLASAFGGIDGSGRTRTTRARGKELGASARAERPAPSCQRPGASANAERQRRERESKTI
jgi:hypothetical protein